MNAPRQCGRRTVGFTLIELLVSIAVLALLVSLMAQLLDRAAVAIAGSGKHMDADTEARLIFNRLAIDIAHAVKRPVLDYSALKQPAGTLATQYSGASVPGNLLPGNDRMAFYSATDGYYSGFSSSPPAGTQKAPVSLVAYLMDTDPYSPGPVLRRLGKGLGWEPNVPSGGNPPLAGVGFLPNVITGPAGQWPNLFVARTTTGSDADFKTVGTQVFRFEYTYLLKSNLGDASGTVYPGKLSPTPFWFYDSSSTKTMASTAARAHTSADGCKDVAAIVVALAILDATSRGIVNSAAYPTLTGLLPDAVDASGDPYKGDIAAAWNAQVNLPTFAASARISARAASGVRVYERYFYLDLPK